MDDYSTLSDEELAALAQVSHGRWLEELFRRFEARLRGCAHRMVAPGEVEDAFQEIAERIMRGLARYRGESSLSTWIYSVARFTCLDVRRRRKTVASIDEVPELESTDARPDDVITQSVMACRTALAIHALPESQQEVVLLRLGAGLSTQATAERLNISADAVKARLRRARVHLRELLGEEMECPACGPGSWAIAAARVV